MQTSQERETRQNDAWDGPWPIRAWSGMNASGYLRVLIRNGFAVSPRRLPAAAILAGLSLCNSALGWLQGLIHGRRIAQTPLAGDPLFVLGHWRAGTTWLHELLTCDPRHTFPDPCAAFCPSHFLLTERLLKRLNGFLLPPQRPMDKMRLSWESPQEDEWALCNLGLPSPYLSLLFPNRPPQGMDYLDLRNPPAADRERWKAGLRRYVQSLTVRDAKRVVLKSPLHTSRIRTLREAFPEARFVHIVRHPFDLFPSTVHTWMRMCQCQGLQVPRFEDVEEFVLDTFCRMYRAFDEDVPTIEPGRLWEVRYEELVRDPVGQMRTVYERLGLGDFEPARPAIEHYAARTAGYRTNRYEISDSTREKIAARWAAYLEDYGYNGAPPSRRS